MVDAIWIAMKVEEICSKEYKEPCDRCGKGFDVPAEIYLSEREEGEDRLCPECRVLMDAEAEKPLVLPPYEGG